MKPLILASGSPRRAKILRDLGVDFEIVKTEAAEVAIPHDPVRTVTENACAKLRAATVAQERRRRMNALITCNFASRAPRSSASSMSVSASSHAPRRHASRASSTYASRACVARHVTRHRRSSASFNLPCSRQASASMYSGATSFARV